ncbi:MAG: hypothetical protein ACM3SO_23065 [Betaproteobacteria bacterium]
MEPSVPDTAVLLAAAPDSGPVLSRMLCDVARPIVAYSVEEALRLLDPGIDLVICTLRFDESRMLEFLAQATRDIPRLRWICCRVLESDLPESSLDAARVAALKLGALAFIDLPALRARQGAEAAAESFRNVVRKHLAAAMAAKNAA